MKVLDKDSHILTHIVSYCDQIDLAMERFGRNYHTFAEDPVIVTQCHSVFCKLANSLETCQKLSERNTLPSLGVRSSLCEISWPIVTARLTIPLPGMSSSMTFPI